MSNSDNGDGEDKEDKSEQEIEELEEKISSLESENKQLKKMLANKKNEMSNQKKRIDTKVQNAQQSKLREVTEDLTKVRRSLSEAVNNEDGDEIISGVKRTLEMLEEVLEDNGIMMIKPDEGDEVDPRMHEVVSTDISEEYPEGRIIKLHSAGYEFEGTVLRPARVTSSR